MGGVSSNTGTVQVCLNQQFGTICGNNFDNSDAQVICSSLGFQKEGTDLWFFWLVRVALYQSVLFTDQFKKK